MANFQLKEPHRPSHLPEHAQWLSGTESGFWFAIDDHDPEKLHFRIRSYDVSGGVLFDRFYITDKPGFLTNKDYHFTHLSHGQYCSISQNNRLFRFTLLSEENNEGAKSPSSEFRNN